MIKDIEKKFGDGKDNLGGIVSALEFLKEKAAHSKLDDVEMIIDSTFRLCLSIYCLSSRGEYIGVEDFTD